MPVRSMDMVGCLCVCVRERERVDVGFGDLKPVVPVFCYTV